MTRRYTITYAGKTAQFWTPARPGDVAERFMLCLSEWPCIEKPDPDKVQILGMQLLPMPEPFCKDERVSELLVLEDRSVKPLAWDAQGRNVQTMAYQTQDQAVADNWRDVETDPPQEGVLVLVQLLAKEKTLVPILDLAKLTMSQLWINRHGQAYLHSARPVLWQSLPIPRQI